MGVEWVEIGPDCRIACGDALDVLTTFADDSADAVLTDPPFGIRDDAWDDMDQWEYARFSMGWLSQARRVAPEMIAFGCHDGCFGRLCEMLWPKVRPIIWNKPVGSQYAGSSERKLWYSFETAYHAYAPDACKSLEVATMLRQAREAAGLSRGAVDMLIRGKKTGLAYRWEEGACLPTPRQVDRLKTSLELADDFEAALERAYKSKCDAPEKADVLTHRTVTNGKHPCQKPVKLFADLLKTALADARALVDLFMGSGTTGIAAMQTGRRFIGIERDPAYFAVARRRLEECHGKGSLFEHAEGRPDA